jgi:hypothetical protein
MMRAQGFINNFSWVEYISMTDEVLLLEESVHSLLHSNTPILIKNHKHWEFLVDVFFFFAFSMLLSGFKKSLEQRRPLPDRVAEPKKNKKNK